MEIPETRYAKTADGVHIAYQVLGDGPVDLVVVATGLGLGEVWRGRRSGSFLHRLASFSRLILFDGRGMGLSDHVLEREQLLTLESRMEDVRAVMDTVDSTRATLLGLDSGFGVAAMFAATLPERTAGLIAYGASARMGWAPDYPIGLSEDELEADIAEIESGWGTDEFAKSWVEALHPSAREDASQKSQTSRLTCADSVDLEMPPSGPALTKNSTSAISCPRSAFPTLVIHRREDRATPFEHGRYLAEHIPGAELVELPGDVHMWDVGDDIPSTVERFVRRSTKRRSSSIVTSRPCCSPTWSTRPRWPPRAVTRHGRGWSINTIASFAATSPGIEDRRWTRLATVFSPRSTVLRGRSAARSPSWLLFAISRSRLRAGVHTGEVQEIDGKAGGIAVTIGARIAALARASEILVSSTVKDLTAGSRLVFDDRGEHELKGVPGVWHLYRVTDLTT